MTNKAIGVVVGGVAALLTVAGRSEGAKIYASTAAGAAGELYVISSTDGSVLQDVGPLNDSGGTNYPITALAFHPQTGVLYGATGNSVAATRATLVTIDPTTARVTVVGTFNAGNTGTTPATMGDLGFDPAGNLYGVGTVGGPQLYRVDVTTGQATLVGASGLTGTSGGALAFAADGTAYGSPNANSSGAFFGTYDTTTGAYTNALNIARPAGGGAYGAFDFDAAGTLFGLNIGPGTAPGTHLVTVAPGTGAVTDLGASVQQLDAIAVAPVPEPAAVGLCAAGGAVLLGRRRRRVRTTA